MNFHFGWPIFRGVCCFREGKLSLFVKLGRFGVEEATVRILFSLIFAGGGV